MISAIQEFINKSSETSLHMASAAGVGYLCARIFTSINAVHGAVFCGVSTLTSKVVTPFFDKFFASPGSNMASKTIGSLVSTATGVAVSATLVSAAGYSISFSAGLVLTCSLVAIEIFALISLTLAAKAVM